MHDVELWKKPINGEKNTFPIIKVEDKIFLYCNDGFHSYPAQAMSRPEDWQKIGKTVLDIDEVCAKASEIFAENFSKFSAKKANPVQYARAFATFLVPSVLSLAIWEELENQDWSEVIIDVDDVLGVNWKSSGKSLCC